VDECLDGGLIQVSKVRGTLTWLLAEHEGMWVDEAEGINDDFTLDGLDGVNNDGDGARGELLEGLLGIDIDGREPAAKAWMGVVPADNCL
jgi:hypothetical protein